MLTDIDYATAVKDSSLWDIIPAYFIGQNPVRTCLWRNFISAQ